MYECGKLKKVLGNKLGYRVILEQCDIMINSRSINCNSVILRCKTKYEILIANFSVLKHVSYKKSLFYEMRCNFKKQTNKHDIFTLRSKYNFCIQG